MASADFAKTHLRDHLASLLIPPISQGVWSIYESAKELCDRNKQPDQILRTFQNMLTRIPEWSESVLSTEVDRIVKATKCTYMDDLIMGVFIAYMKSFASLHYRGDSTEIKLEFDRPSLAKFIHELYKNCARRLWQTAYLFKTLGVTFEQQARNRQDIDRAINECMEQTIRSFLPWESITKKYFSETHTETVVAEPAVEEEAPAAPTKAVSFDSAAESDDESAVESDSDEEEERPPRFKMTEDDAALSDIEDFDEKKKEEPKEEPKQEEVDPMKELESKLEDTLVLNL